MSNNRRKRIENAIYSLMQENALNSYIKGRNIQLEQDKYYLYVECINSQPVIAYAFNVDEPIYIGRNSDTCAIVINHREVSRQQCQLYVSGNLVVLRDLGAKNPTVIKNGLNKKKLGYQEAITILKKDKVIIGDIIFQIFLLQGYDIILN